MTATRLAELHASASFGARPWSVAEFTALLADPSTLCILRDHSFVLGRVVLDEAEILTLATDPAHRRQGHAARALAAFEAAALARGARCILLDVATDNLAAHRLYLAAGYGETGRRRAYYPRPGADPADAVLMAKSLSPA